MEENKQLERKVIKISRKRIIITIVVLFLVIVLGWVVLSIGSSRVMSTGESVIPSLGSSKGIVNSAMPYNDIYQEGNSSITDTREFMKTSYNSSIQTRNVSKVVTEIKNIIKGADGRVDSINSSEKYGYVGFVVAKSKFDDFKNEIESITNRKLYTESVSSTNLLTTKQGIEEQTNNTNDSLNSLTNQKNNITTTHNNNVSSINKDLAATQAELNKVRLNINSETNTAILVSLHNQETILVGQYATQKQKLSDENKNYNTKLASLNSSINTENSNLDNINKQDNQFMDNIETVQGYISVRWVSIWGMAVIFSPIHPTWVIIILIIAAFIIFRKRMPKVVVE